jgi:hypothetical protein
MHGATAVRLYRPFLWEEIMEFPESESLGYLETPLLVWGQIRDTIFQNGLL